MKIPFRFLKTGKVLVAILILLCVVGCGPEKMESSPVMGGIYLYSEGWPYDHDRELTKVLKIVAVDHKRFYLVHPMERAFDSASTNYQVMLDGSKLVCIDFPLANHPYRRTLLVGRAEITENEKRLLNERKEWLRNLPDNLR